MAAARVALIRRRRLLQGLGLGTALGLAGPLQAQVPGVVDTPEPRDAPAPLPGDETTLPRPMPRWLLQAAHNGRPLSPEDLRGRFQLVAFGFVSCPDVCPTTLAEMQQVLAALGPRAAQLAPLFISVDPERDTLAVLREYTAAFDKRIIGLTGSATLVQRAAAAFKVRYEKVREPHAAPGVYTLDHTAGLYLVGPDGQLLSRLGYGLPVKDIVARVERWMDAAGVK